MKKIDLEKWNLSFQMNEELKLLRTNIQLRGPEKQVILITSSAENEGKSTISLELCRQFTELGKTVLLIDADMRKSVLQRKAEILVPSGLSEFLGGQCSMEDAVYETETEGCFVMFAGAVPPDPTARLSGKAMEQVIAQARERYDYVIIDSSPVDYVVDAMILAKYADGIVLVIRSGEVRCHTAQSVIKKLRKTDCEILGVVLNEVGRKGDYSRYGRSYYKRSDSYYRKRNYGA